MENQNFEGLTEHNQHVCENLLEHESSTISSVLDDGILSEDLKNNHENDTEDPHVLMPEKVINTEKQLSLENTFEVIDKESKIFHDIEENTEVTNLIPKDEEKENVIENDPLSLTKIEDFKIHSKSESPNEEFLVSEKLESKTIDISKSVINQEHEPVNVIQSEVKISDIHPAVVIPEVFAKKDTDEGDACDIKIGPEELFCRIGLGKIIQFYNKTSLILTIKPLQD